MSKGTNIAQVLQLTNGMWARWKFCVPWKKTALIYAGYLWKITLNPTLNSCWKPKREAVSKSSSVKSYWLPVSRAVCQGLVLPKGSEKRHLGFGAECWVWSFGSRQGYPGKFCPRASHSVAELFVTEQQWSPPKAQPLWTWGTTELCGCSLIWEMSWWLTQTLNFQDNFQ